MNTATDMEITARIEILAGSETNADTAGIHEDAAAREARTYFGCISLIEPVREALAVLSGKWKLPIIISLSFGTKRFTQIADDIPKITDRMLSKELRDLESHGLIRRNVRDSSHSVIDYSMTDYGRSLDPVILELARWGRGHKTRGREGAEV